MNIYLITALISSIDKRFIVDAFVSPIWHIFVATGIIARATVIFTRVSVSNYAHLETLSRCTNFSPTKSSCYHLHMDSQYQSAQTTTAALDLLGEITKSQYCNYMFRRNSGINVTKHDFFVQFFHRNDDTNAKSNKCGRCRCTESRTAILRTTTI